MTKKDIDELWYKVERKLRENGKTLAILVTADGHPALDPIVVLPEERRPERVSELEEQVAALKAENAKLRMTSSQPEQPSGILGRVKCILKATPGLTIDELLPHMNGISRERLYHSVYAAVNQGTLTRQGQRREAKFTLTSLP